MAHLQTLPFDLLFKITSSAQSLADLHSLILASRPCYNAFSIYRNSIIRSVLMTEMGPANYRELLAIVHIPPGVSTMGLYREVRRASSGNPKTDTNDETEEVYLITVLQPYLKHYFSTRPFEDPCDAGSTSQILWVYKIMRRLIDRYFVYTCKLLLGLWSSSSGNMLDYATGAALVAPLSRAERARLQRAFLRYELYSRLFPYEDGKRSSVRSSISGKSQFDLFIRHLEPWEVEELCSIHRFLFNLAADYMGDLEDQFVESYLSCPGAVSVVPTGIPGQIEMKQGEKMVPFHEPELVGLDVFEKWWQSNGMADFTNQLASLGLEFFSTLIDASTIGERRDRIRSLGLRQLGFGERHFLPEALTHSPDVSESSSEEEWEENICCDNEEEDATRPNTGYRDFVRSIRQFRWMRQSLVKPCYREIFEPTVVDFTHNLPDDPFWEQGCVFWNRARLVKFRRDLELNPEHFVGHKKIGRYAGRGINRWMDRMSVKNRLKGIMIPESQWRKLLDDFAWHQ